MSDSVIVISSKKCQENKECILAYNENLQQNGTTKATKGGSIFFVNVLEKNIDSTIYFYNENDAKVAGNEIQDFCTNVSTNPLTVSLMVNCKTKSIGTYDYSVAATGYEELDPVIIIEPPISRPFITPPLIVVALLSLVIGFFVKKYLFNKD